MFTAATVLRILAPAAAGLVSAIYVYYKYGRKTALPDLDPAGLDPALVDAIGKLVDKNRNLDNPAVVREILKLLRDVLREKLGSEEDKRDEQEAGECWTYLKTGTCEDRPNCKFNHPPRSKDKLVSEDKAKEKEAEKPSQTDSKVSEDKTKEKEAEKPSQTDSKEREGEQEAGGEEKKVVVEETSSRKSECKVRFQTCENRPNCKFNHPPRSKDKLEREECVENPSQTHCKFYMRPGGCKYGAACRYSHGRKKPSVPPVTDTNFAGLPIRPGERVCAYYMRHGECKYGSNCRFSHPDPVAEGRSDPSSGYDKGGPALRGASETTAAPWLAPGSMSETPLYTPMMIPPSQGVSSQNAEWNGYQSPARSMSAHPPDVMNNSVTERQYPYRNQVEEFPERPGQPVCSYFLRTGDCKFKYSCKYHHPKIQTAGSPSCILSVSDKGLPLRPGQSICTQYSRHGICNSGPACEYDHPSLSAFSL